MVLINRVKIIVLVVGLYSITNLGFAQDLAQAREAYNKGVELVNQDQLESAMQSFQKVVEICDILEDEESVETKMAATDVIPGLQLRIASKYLSEKDFGKGIPALEKTIEYSNEYMDNATKEKAEGQLTKVYLAYGSSLMKSNKYEEADKYFDKVLDVDPKNAKVYLIKGVMCKQQEKSEGVKTNLMKSIEVASATNDRRTESSARDQGSKYFLKIALDAFNENNYNKCIENGNIALEFDPKQEDALFLLVQSYNKQSKWDEAINAGEKALVSSSDSEKKAGVYFEMANAYKQKGEVTNACENFKNAMVGPYLENAKYQIEHILKCDN